MQLSAYLLAIFIAAPIDSALASSPSSAPAPVPAEGESSPSPAQTSSKAPTRPRQDTRDPAQGRAWVPAAGRGLGGGYWKGIETRPPPPKSPTTVSIVGGALFSVGALRVGLSSWSLLKSSREFGENCSGSGADTCEAERTVAWVNMGFGAALAVSGTVYLVVAATRAIRHRRWRARWKGGMGRWR